MRQHLRFKKHFRVSLALHVVVLLFSHFSFAQTYPVSATLQLTPPYSVYLSDYTVNDQMKLHLLLRDLNEPSYQVRLSLVLEGVGIRIETNPNNVPPPITIEGGIPAVLSAEDLAPYLDTRNLIFSGITRQEYEQRAALPEGFYRFCFRVYDYKRKDVLLSQEACAQAWFMLNDPPRINTPLCGTTLPVRDPQNILFQWLPMNANSPNSAFTTEYEFTLVEIRPPGRNPNDAINVGYPLFQTTTQQTSLIYGLLEPPLIPGQEYAFRVRAIDTEGRDQFKNRGYSEVCTFKFGDSTVPPPEGMNVYVEGERRAKVTWYTTLETDRYRVEYRKKSTGTGYTWFTIETTQDNALIQDLEPDTEYEVRVVGILKNQIGSYSPTKNFRTTPPRVYSCGQSVASMAPLNTNPLRNAMVGQIWKLDLFDMIVLDVSGSNGTFSGFGGVLVPFLGVKLYCQFENIQINEKQELIAGEVLSVKGDIEALKKRLVDINEQKKRDKAKSSGYVFEGVDIKFEGTIDSLYVNDAGEVIAVVASNENSTNGSSKKEERKIDTKKGADNRITDDSGNVYVVNKDGKIEKMGSTGASGTTAVASNVNYRVEFESSSNQSYGFDQQQHSEHERNYEKYERDGKVYTIPWKSVASGSRDVVIAKSTESRKDFLKEVIYKTDQGLLLRKPGNQENEVQLTVEGFGDQSTEQVTAYYKRKEAEGKEKEVIAGKLNLVSYDKLVERLVIVSVNNTAPNISTTELAESLNTIFAPAAVEWMVESQSIDGINYDTSGKSGLDDGSSGLFSNYTGEMRTIINAYKDKYDIAKNTWYLFLVPNSESGRTQGFMPRKKQAGFIFIEQLGEASLAKVIAHEIGHGAFRLEHTFDTYNTLAKSSTDNLMDYQPNGITLHKYQWDLIHDPAAVLGLFEGDEGGAMVDASGLTASINSNIIDIDKVIVITENSIKLNAKHFVKNGGEVKFRLTIKPEGGGSDILNPTSDWKKVKNDESWILDINTVTEGKYILSYKVGDKTKNIDFYVRTKAYDYSCGVCGRNLSFNIENYETIFPGNSNITEEHVKLFNEALKIGKFNSCQRVAHFYAQVKVESTNFTALQESSKYHVHSALQNFAGRESTKNWFKQSFFDEKEYLDYFHFQVYEVTTDSTNAYSGLDYKTFKWKQTSITDTIRIPTAYKKQAGYFKKLSLKKSESEEKEKKFFSTLYSNQYGNGAPSTEDGFKYRGQGAIHLTWRDNYRDVSKKCNDLFQTEYKWENNPSEVSSDLKAAIYSGVAYFHFRLKGDLKLLNGVDIRKVSLEVNGGTFGIDLRVKAYNDLMSSNLFSNCKPKAPKE